MYENRLVVSVREAAEITGYVESRIRRLIAERKLKAYRPGGVGDIRIYVSDLKAWLEGEGEQPPRTRHTGYTTSSAA